MNDTIKTALIAAAVAAALIYASNKIGPVKSVIGAA